MALIHAQRVRPRRNPATWVCALLSLVVILEDTDGDGVADTSEAFVQDRDASGRQHAIDRGRIESIHPLSVSIMPRPAALQMGAQEVADVATFLLRQNWSLTRMPMEAHRWNAAYLREVFSA